MFEGECSFVIFDGQVSYEGETLSVESGGHQRQQDGGGTHERHDLILFLLGYFYDFSAWVSDGGASRFGGPCRDLRRVPRRRRRGSRADCSSERGRCRNAGCSGGPIVDGKGAVIDITYSYNEDGAVTVRERDSMEQVRVKIDELEAYFADKFDF